MEQLEKARPPPPPPPPPPLTTALVMLSLLTAATRLAQLTTARSGSVHITAQTPSSLNITATSCNCEKNGVRFCNFEDGGSCESYAEYRSQTACAQNGLPAKGTADCQALCFTAAPTTSPTVPGYTYAPTGSPTASPTLYVHITAQTPSLLKITADTVVEGAGFSQPYACSVHVGDLQCVDHAYNGYKNSETHQPYTCVQLKSYCTHLTLGPGIRTSCPRTCGTCGSLNISGKVTVTIRGVRFSGGSGSAIVVGQGATVRAINCTIEKRRAALVSLPSFLPELLVCVRC